MAIARADDARNVGGMTELLLKASVGAGVYM
jgi:hypothetical protein